jgi:hypothetical protein
VTLRALAPLVCVAALAPAVVRAQTGEAPVALLVAAGAGSTPDLRSSLGETIDRVAALVATVGLRGRPNSRVFVDATVDAIGAALTGDEVAIAPSYTPGVAYSRVAPRYMSADAFTSAAVRIGFEVPAEDARVRVSAGGGYMWEVREPFTAIAAGIGTGERRVRFAFDVEYRRFGVPMEDFTVTVAAPMVPVVTRTRKANTFSTFVRAGIEIALAR